MAKQSMNEKRKYPRVPDGQEFDLRVSGTGKTTARILDRSAGGLSLESKAEFEKGMHLWLNFPMRFRGEIRYVERVEEGVNRYGIRFHAVEGSIVN